MQLHFAPYSPYVRKVRVVAAERSLSEQIELVQTDTWAVPPSLYDVNPLGKVPALETDEGIMLYDSRVICEYLDGLGQGPRLFPEHGAGRMQALRLQALGDGIMDAAVAVVVERSWPPESRRASWIARQTGAIDRSLRALNVNVSELETLSIGSVSIAVALSYVLFRLPDEPWLSRLPALERWYDESARRPSMRTTDLRDA